MAVHPPIVSPFTHGDSVTITITDLSDNSVVVNAAACVEIGSTGYYKYVPALIIDSKSYLFIMTNGTAAMDRIGTLGPILPGSLAAADVSGNLPAAVNEQANIDFGALQKASLDAATPTVTVSDKTGFALSVTPPTAVEIRTEMDDHSTQLAAIASDIGEIQTDMGVFLPGMAGIPWEAEVTDVGTGLPIADALVWLTTDAAGLNLVRSQRTSSFGKVNFTLDAGTYYLRWRKDGYDEPLAATVVVS